MLCVWPKHTHVATVRFNLLLSGLGHEKGGKFASKSKLSVCQFLMLAKDCKMSNHGMSLLPHQSVCCIQPLFFCPGCTQWKSRNLLILSLFCDSAGISFSICLDTFVTVNQDEVDDFLRGELPYAHLSDMLQMDFQEFQLALDLMVQHSCCKLTQG